MHLKVKNDQFDLTYSQQEALDNFLRGLISAVYLQVRDTVGEEIRRDLGSKIRDGFQKLFETGLQKMIEGKFES